jgi:hypothetical protein
MTRREANGRHESWAGYAVAGLGALHLAVWGYLTRGEIAGIVRDGVAGAIGLDSARMLAWYGGVFLGVVLVLLGLLLVSFVHAAGRPAPGYVGWALVALGVCGAVMQPVSGAPLVAGVGLVIALRPGSRHGRGSRGEPTGVRYARHA